VTIETGEIFVVPACGFAPKADGILARGLAGEIVGDVPAGCEISWGVVGSDAAFIVAKDHVHDPVQGVLDGPVRSDHRADRGGQHHQRGDVEACLVGGLAVDFAPAFDHDNGFQAGPLVARLQPVDFVDHV
jgi:hypothetical protein